MPELPEVETVRRGLLRVLPGRRITRCQVREPRLRWPVDEAALSAFACGATIVDVRRRAKYLLIDLAASAASGPAAVPAAPEATHPSLRGALMVHLGMSGWLGLRQPSPPRKHDHVLFQLDDGRTLCFNDARRFGSIHAVAPAAEPQHKLLVHLGAEPLDAAAFTGEYLHARCRGRGVTIKERLMDATCVVGVGNIYASEALFRAGVHPLMRAGALSRPRAARLVQAVRATLRDAIERGGTTLRDFMNADGLVGMFAPRLRVYGKHGAPCPRTGHRSACAGTVRRCVQGGRSTYYCPRCQTR